MRRHPRTTTTTFLMLLTGLSLVLASCGSSDSEANNSTNDTTNNTANSTTQDDTAAPSVLMTVPSAGESSVPTNRGLRVTFSEAMDPATLNDESFVVTGPNDQGVVGSVTYSGTQARFLPTSDLALATQYRATVTLEATDLAGNSLASDFEWSFTTSAVAALGPAPVELGMAGGFAILSKAGIDTVPTSAVTGNIGVSPIDSTALTGFSLSLDATNQFALSDQVTGKVFAADYEPPTPSNLTSAISDLGTAYTDAAVRTTPDFTELGAGEIGGQTLVPGLYKWGTGVTISTDVTLDGGPNDVWIFQIAGDVTQASDTTVTLTGGAAPKNIFWQAFGQVMIGTNAHFEGNVLCETAIILETGASVNGRLLAQTAVTLDQNTVTKPAQ